MDKMIQKIQKKVSKDNKAEQKDLKSLPKVDRKNDKIVDRAKMKKC